MTIDCSVIILSWNTCTLLEHCLCCVYETLTEITFEVIVIDNGSIDGSQSMVRERFPAVRLVQNQENVGFARGNNQGAALSVGRYLLFLNSDALLQPGAVRALLSAASAEQRAGVVGAQLRNTDGSFQASHSPFPNLWQELLIVSGVGRMLCGRWYPSHGPQERRGPQVVDYVEGACMLARREAYAAVKGMDEGYFMYAEDVDLCYTLRQQGWQVLYQPAARVVHLGSGSSRNRRPQREADLYASRVRFFRLHYGSSASTLLRALFLCSTAIKVAMHGAIRLASQGRRGRPVVPLRQLAAKLMDADRGAQSCTR
jgi:N-acetylglucosaminyl-diphospho-decaprenol L-rhamnosyltransferase